MNKLLIALLIAGSAHAADKPTYVGEGRLGIDTVTHKLCNRCNQLKPRSSFSMNYNTLDGIMSNCRECRKEMR